MVLLHQFANWRSRHCRGTPFFPPSKCTKNPPGQSEGEVVVTGSSWHVLAMAATICFILSLQDGGNSHPWNSSQVIGLLVGFGVICVTSSSGRSISMSMPCCYRACLRSGRFGTWPLINSSSSATSFFSFTANRDLSGNILQYSHYWRRYCRQDRSCDPNHIRWCGDCPQLLLVSSTLSISTPPLESGSALKSSPAPPSPSRFRVA